MKKRFSSKWNSSSQIRKQRKYRFNAPLHIRRRFLSVNFSKELREQYGRRNFPIRTDDVVKIATGQFKGKSGKVTKVFYTKSKVFVEKMELSRKDGSKYLYPMHASNLMITKLNLDDKKRVVALERNTKVNDSKINNTKTNNVKEVKKNG